MATRTTDKTHTPSGPWMAALFAGEQDNGDPGDPITTKRSAQRACRSLGWMLDQAEDAEAGLWMVLIPQADEDAMRTEGEIVREADQGKRARVWATIDPGDALD